MPPPPNPKARVIANYLPQFHPIPENDQWWGKGFTEWTNTAKAKPQFRGHFQPNLPADLGFYDLRVPETRAEQAALARAHGIEGFCYWHYWFAGERLLERPFNEVLDSGQPDFPFCLGWANHTWSMGSWAAGDERRILKEQTYPPGDAERHFEFLVRAFTDRRYIRVEGKPLLVIYRPLELPDARRLLDGWRDLAARNGLPGLHVVATLEYKDRLWDAAANGFDAVTVWPMSRILATAKPASPTRLLARRGLRRFKHLADRLIGRPAAVYDYRTLHDFLVTEKFTDLPTYQMALPNWDTTPRYDRKAIIFTHTSPEEFRVHLRRVLQRTLADPPEQRIIFAKSWNEWAEGNYFEPDMRFGLGFLKVLKEELGV